MDSLLLKTCGKCKVEQPRENYHKNKACKDGLRPTCKECYADKCRAYREANREKIRNQQRAYYEATQKERQASSKAWREANPEKARGCVRAYYEANREKARAYFKVYREANPEKARAHRQNRRARKRSAEGSHTTVEWEAKLKLYKGRCHWCRKKVKGITHADHVIPLSKGGSNYIENVVPSCAKCNLSKHNKLPHEFAGRLF